MKKSGKTQGRLSGGKAHVSEIPREELKARYCRHYTNCVRDEECNAGINYKDLADGRPMHSVLPCFVGMNDHRSWQRMKCAKLELPTQEELRRNHEELRQKLYDVAHYVLPLTGPLKLANRLSNGRFRPNSETIECPKCKKRLRMVVRANGHTSGACETEGCLAWLE